MYTQNTRRTLKVFRCSQLDFQKQELQERLGETPECKTIFWSIWSGRLCCSDLEETVRGGSVRFGYFSRREFSGRELPGGELSASGYCPGENLPVTVFCHQMNLCSERHLKSERSFSMRAIYIEGGRWHSNQTSAHCHKQFSFIPQRTQKPESAEIKLIRNLWGGVHPNTGRVALESDNCRLG